MWEALRLRAQAFDGALAWTVQTLDLAAAASGNRSQALITSGDFFTTLGVTAGAWPHFHCGR